MSIVRCADEYKAEKLPLVVFATRVRTGSSRDWAAKGSTLLGIRAVITQSFERIHAPTDRMGVVPLVFEEGLVADAGAQGDENRHHRGLHGDLKPHQR